MGQHFVCCICLQKVEVTAAAPWAQRARQGACTCAITHSSGTHLQRGGRCLCSHGCTDQVTKKKMHLKMLVQNSKAVTETNCQFSFHCLYDRMVIV